MALINYFGLKCHALGIKEHVHLGMSSSELRGQLAEDYTNKVKTDIFQMWKELPRRDRDSSHPFFEKIEEGMELFWVYRPVSRHFPKGARDWFQIERSVDSELVLIRDRLIPMLTAAEWLGDAEGQRPAFDMYARRRLLTFKESVESYWEARKVPGPPDVTIPAEANIQTLLSLLQADRPYGGADKREIERQFDHTEASFANTRAKASAYWGDLATLRAQKVALEAALAAEKATVARLEREKKDLVESNSQFKAQIKEFQDALALRERARAHTHTHTFITWTTADRAGA